MRLSSLISLAAFVVVSGGPALAGPALARVVSINLCTDQLAMMLAAPRPLDGLIALVLGGDGPEPLVMRDIRLPRAVLGVMIGASPGLSGAALQGYLRNPLAEPGLIGVSGRAAAWMPQARDIAWPVSVETLVALGRTPHVGGWQGLGPRDHAHVDAAPAMMGLGPLRHRTATRLSGGEPAMALIARALAQDTPLLMADEPIAGLDPANQIATMQVFSRLAQEGRAVIASLHDLGLAARHCTRLLMLGEGGVAADGPPADVLTPETLARIFHVSAHYAETPNGPVFRPPEVIC